MYGTSPSHGQSTTLDNTQVTSHAQTLTAALTPYTPQHFAVQSTGASNNTSTSGDNTSTALPSNVTLPDMQIKVPTANISIGNNPNQTYTPQIPQSNCTDPTKPLGWSVGWPRQKARLLA